MGGMNSWRTTVTGSDWMRDLEKRVLHEERRPTPRTAAAILGPGFGPYSIQVNNWNDSETAFNGFFHSAPGAANSPDPAKHWMGITQAAFGGFGTQRVVEYRNDADPATMPGDSYSRTFWTPYEGAQRLFSPWTQDNAPTAPVVTSDGAKLSKTASQTYAADTWVKITFDRQDYSDAAGFADQANSRLVIPAAGRYMVGAEVAHATKYGSVHLRQFILVKGDSAPNTGGNQLARTGDTSAADTAKSEWYDSLATVGNFTAGDYVTLWFRSTAASNTGAPNGAPFNLWAQRIK